MTRDPDGLGAIESALLGALDDLGARLIAPFVKSAAVIGRVEQQLGIPPRYAYETLVRLADRWRTHLLLVQPHGNFGGPDDPPAAPRYTEARLSALGEIALDLERSSEVTIPFGLIEGNWFLDGRRPPFDPTRVLEAIAAVARTPDLGDDEIGIAVGPAAFANGCLVEGDVDGLHRGESVELVLTARISTREADGRTFVSISSIPPLSSPNAVAEAIKARAHHPDRFAHNPRLAEQMLPIDDLSVDSARRQQIDRQGRVVHLGLADTVTVRIRPEAEAAEVVEQLLTVHGIRFPFFRAQLREPLADTIRRSAASASREEVLTALASLRSGM